MRKAGGGSIIHMASVTGHLGHPGITVYGATKGGLIALARGQGVELAVDGIRVNTVSPGTVDSPMLHRFLAENATDTQKAREAFDRLHPKGQGRFDRGSRGGFRFSRQRRGCEHHHHRYPLRRRLRRAGATTNFVTFST